MEVAVKNTHECSARGEANANGRGVGLAGAAVDPSGGVLKTDIASDYSREAGIGKKRKKQRAGGGSSPLS
jgi:hypothetical protein